MVNKVNAASAFARNSKARRFVTMARLALGGAVAGVTIASLFGGHISSLDPHTVQITGAASGSAVAIALVKVLHII